MIKKNGFSIIEVILAVGIIAVIGVFTSSLLTRTYRTTSDADLIGRLKQNGEVALNTISEAIRMADSVACYGPSGQWIVIRTVQGDYKLYRFSSVVPSSGTPKTRNSALAMQTNLDPEQLPFFCAGSTPAFSSDIFLTDTDPDSGVSINNGQFSVVASTVGTDTITKKDTVKIVFDVGPAANSGGQTQTVHMETTVKVR